MNNYKLWIMRNILITLFLLLPAMSFAQNKKVLAVYLKDDTAVYFLLMEKPVITFVNDSVQIISDTNEAKVKRSSVNEFKFLNEIPTKIEHLTEADDQFTREHYKLSKDAIVIEGLVPGNNVCLLSLDGKVIISTSALENGIVTISLDTLSSGIYIITYNKTAIKFIKS